MFGKNEITKSFRAEAGKLLVNEIWYTMQGEGPDAGRAAVFIRLSKCNLRCYFCDTEFESGKLMDVSEIIDVIRTMRGEKCNLVVITGGEPLLQDIVSLISCLNVQLNMSVSVETAGTVYYPELDFLFSRQRNKIICSPKTGRVHPELVGLVSAWKYIVKAGAVSEHDGLPNQSTQRANVNQQLFRPPLAHHAEIYVQPMDEQDQAVNESNLQFAGALVMKYGYRLSLQMHKLVGLP